MGELELITAALAAGGGAGVTAAASSAVQDAYTGLKNLLKHRLAGRSGTGEVLEANEADPGVWQARLGADLTATGAHQDRDVQAAALLLLGLVDPDGARSGRYTVDAGGASGVRVGDGTVHVETNYGVATGTAEGPITINYGNLPSPPAPPGAN